MKVKRRSWNEWYEYCKERCGGSYDDKRVGDIGSGKPRVVKQPIKVSDTAKCYRTTQWEDTYIKIDGVEEYAYSNQITQTLKKYRCIGGELNGQRHTTQDATGYIGYNVSSRSGNKDRAFILVHPSVLK